MVKSSNFTFWSRDTPFHVHTTCEEGSEQRSLTKPPLRSSVFPSCSILQTDRRHRDFHRKSPPASNLAEDKQTSNLQSLLYKDIWKKNTNTMTYSNSQQQGESSSSGHICNAWYTNLEWPFPILSQRETITKAQLGFANPFYSQASYKKEPPQTVELSKAIILLCASSAIAIWYYNPPLVLHTSWIMSCLGHPNHVLSQNGHLLVSHNVCSPILEKFTPVNATWRLSVTVHWSSSLHTLSGSYETQQTMRNHVTCF